MNRGWSVNLSQEGYDAEIVLPVPILFSTRAGPVIEIVFWSAKVSRWVHVVAEPFQRELPQGHVQFAVGDLAWVSQVERRLGSGALFACVAELEQSGGGFDD